MLLLSVHLNENYIYYDIDIKNISATSNYQL